jgi:hypothetical protein
MDGTLFTVLIGIIVGLVAVIYNQLFNRVKELESDGDAKGKLLAEIAGDIRHIKEQCSFCRYPRE